MKKMVFILSLILSCMSFAATPSEKHAFHVFGKVKYRCYAGYDGKKVVDEVTKQDCDNKSYESTVIDKIIAIEIKDEPDPEDSKELVGDWLEQFEFKGRKFEIAISLFKEVSPLRYRIRLVADDTEPMPRKSAVFYEMKKVKDMNPLSIDYSSAGKKEEISFWVEVKPSAKK